MIKNPILPEFELGTLIGNFIGLAIIIALLLTLAYLIWGGISWILAGGEKAALETARERITQALVGLFIVVSAWAIISLLTYFLGIPFPDLPIPTLGDTPSGVRPPEAFPDW